MIKCELLNAASTQVYHDRNVLDWLLRGRGQREDGARRPVVRRQHVRARAHGGQRRQAAASAQLEHARAAEVDVEERAVRQNARLHATFPKGHPIDVSKLFHAQNASAPAQKRAIAIKFAMKQLCNANALTLPYSRPAHCIVRYP